MPTQNKDYHQNGQVGILMVPCPGQSHLNMLLHLSQLISSTYQIPIHFSTIRSESESNQSDPIHFHNFSLPPNPNPNPSSFVNTIEHTITHVRPLLFQLMQQLSNKYRKLIVIYDFLVSSIVQNVKEIHNAQAYTFHPVCAYTQFFNVWENIDQKPFDLQFEHHQIPPSNKGCYPPELAGFIADQYRVKAGFEQGRIYDTNRIIEGSYINLLEKLSNINHFTIGPFHPVDPPREKTRHQCLEWLDQQETKSVLYVSFGTMASMSVEQIQELAVGLERSEQKFIWVLRSATNEDNAMKIFNQIQNLEEIRIKNRGMILRDWAPQLEILSHLSVGGFMTHCGWSSCIETISMGVPILGWPMNADQPKNGVLMSKVLKIGFMVREWDHRDEIVSSSQVDKIVRELMVGKKGDEVRKRAIELGKKVRDSIDDGGSTRLELDSFIDHITRSDYN